MTVAPQDIKWIETRLSETIHEVRQLAETKPSSIFYLRGQRDYVLKRTKRVPLGREFESLQKVYDLWLTQKACLEFRVPKPYLLGPEGQFILMAYIDGETLLAKLIAEEEGVETLFSRAGRGLKQYHDLMTDRMHDGAEDLSEYEYMADTLRQPGGSLMRERLGNFPPETRRVLFKDFTPANVMVSEAGHIYFVDIQEIFYTGSLYYDLARFIDTTKVFSIIKKPARALRGIHHIRRAVQAFLSGYGHEVDHGLLKRMQVIHQKEHVYIKNTVTPMNALVLRTLYTVLK
ncbi:MAG: aminoglycoside phosphotransferase family protein [Phycisphaerae bacterium]|nr:aminoglycoside phosphotransferase family protein [Phycisphaerae bacterium]